MEPARTISTICRIAEEELMSRKPMKTKIGRDAKTGRFIPVKEAARRKNTAVVETIRRSK